MSCFLFCIFLLFPCFCFSHNQNLVIFGDDAFIIEALKKRSVQEGYFVETASVTNSQEHVLQKLFIKEKPSIVFLIASSDKDDDETLYENYLKEVQILQFACGNKVQKLLYIVPSSVYPTDTKPPYSPESLLPPIKAKDPYSRTKRAVIDLCTTYNDSFSTNFVACIRSSLYGPKMPIDSIRTYSLTGIIHQVFDAKAQSRDFLMLPGTGKTFLEYLYIDDFVTACFSILKKYEKKDPINIGSGRDLNLNDYLQYIQRISKYKKPVIYDVTEDDSLTRQVLNIHALQSLGWSTETTLQVGLEKTLTWYVRNKAPEPKNYEEILNLSFYHSEP